MQSIQHRVCSGLVVSMLYCQFWG